MRSLRVSEKCTFFFCFLGMAYLLAPCGRDQTSDPCMLSTGAVESITELGPGTYIEDVSELRSGSRAVWPFSGPNMAINATNTSKMMISNMFPGRRSGNPVGIYIVC